MDKFIPGEIAVFIGPVVHPNSIGRINTGDEVTILSYWGAGEWEIDKTDSNGRTMIAYEIYLRKRPDDHQQRFRDTLKPCDKDFRHDLAKWLRPTETEVKEGLKGILQPFDNHFEGYDR